MSETNAPIIVVKRVKKGGHGHHGGAWKVALADFVTAMMAFFMLLWLVGSTTPEQKAGISDYFQNPTALDGVTGVSNSAIDLGGGMIATTSSDHVPDPDAPLDDNSKQLDIEAEARAIEYKHLEELKEQIEAAIDANPDIKQFRDQMLIDIMSDGLRIQIVDKENRSMFDSGSATLKSYTAKILGSIVPAINEVSNKVSLSGHTDQTPYVSYDERLFKLGAIGRPRQCRASRARCRRACRKSKIGRVVGLGSSVPFVKDDPFNPINRRISMIVLNKKAEAGAESGSWAGARTTRCAGTPRSRATTCTRRRPRRTNQAEFVGATHISLRAAPLRKRWQTAQLLIRFPRLTPPVFPMKLPRGPGDGSIKLVIKGVSVCLRRLITCCSHSPLRSLLPLSAHAGGYGLLRRRQRRPDDTSNVNDVNFDENDTSYKIFAGYMLLPFLGVEGGYVDFGSPNRHYSGVGSVELQVDGWEGFVVGQLPLGPVDLFAKAGVLSYNVDVKTSGTEFAELLRLPTATKSARMVSALRWVWGQSRFAANTRTMTSTTSTTRTCFRWV